MKKMKKILLPLLSLLFVAGAGTALVSCIDKGNSSTSGSNSEITDSSSESAGSSNSTGSNSTDSGSTSETPQTHTHVYGEWVVTKEATCTELGEKQRTCVENDHTQTVVIPALGHDWDMANIIWTWEGYQEASATVLCKNDSMYKMVIFATVKSEVTKEATTEEAGERIYTAEIIFQGTTYTDTAVEVIPKLNSGIVGVEGLVYTLSDDGEAYSVTGIGTCTAPEIVIPATYNGLPVTAIGEKAFSWCVKLTSVTIPGSVTTLGNDVFPWCDSLTSITVEESNPVYHSAGNCVIERASKTLVAGCKGSVIPDDGSVTSIGDRAFFGCSGFENITIPNSITSIGANAFEGCYGLTSITIPESVITIGDYAFSWCDSLTRVTVLEGVTAIGGYAFSRCDRLTDISIPNGVTSIGDFAFQYCSRLTSIAIPDSVIEIGEYAFWNCIGLENITIGKGVIGIGDYAFSWCDSLTSIAVEEGNPVYYSAGDCVIERASKTLVAGCKGSVIPDDGSVTSIGRRAFYGCSGLTNIIIPNGVTAIGDWSFAWCSSLTDVTIGEDVTTIGNFAFDGYNGLTEVYYKGTATEWDSISIGSYNTSLTDAVKYYYSETEPTEEGNYWHYVDGEPTVWEESSPEETGSKGLAYTLSSDGSYYAVSGIGSCTDTEIVVPSTYSGLPVTVIRISAFEKCSSLESITIPDSVTAIGDYAFYECSSLTSITVKEGNPVYHSAGDCLIETASKILIVGCKNSIIPHDGSVTTIGTSAFEGYSSLTSITIPESVTSIWDRAFWGCINLKNIMIPEGVTSIENGTFYNCKSLESITIPERVTSIGMHAFMGCSSLESITIPESVTTIGNFAFYDCSSLAGITIPKGVNSIGNAVFRGCIGLASIAVKEGNPVYHSAGNCLIETASKTLIVGCKNSVIPDDGSVTTIWNYAFYNCSSLESITIPESVTTIGSQAFMGCSSLTEVYYKGTAAEWDSISIGSYNTSLTDAVKYYYSETEPTEEGNYWHYVDGEPTVWTKEE